MALLGTREDALAELRKVSSLDLGPGGHMTEEAVFYQLRDFPKLTETAKQGEFIFPSSTFRRNSSASSASDTSGRFVHLLQMSRYRSGLS